MKTISRERLTGDLGPRPRCTVDEPHAPADWMLILGISSVPICASCWRKLVRFVDETEGR